MNMNSEQQYIDLYQSHRDTVHRHAPTCMNALRDRALEHLRRVGFPPTTSEYYKYTDMQAAFAPDYGLNLDRRPVDVNTADLFRCNVPNLSATPCFVINDTFYSDGRLEAALPAGVYVGSIAGFAERHPEQAARYYGQAAHTDHDPIAALNTLFAQDGLVVYVPTGVTLEQPVQLINLFRYQNAVCSEPDEVQGVKTEGEGSVPKYMTDPESRRQRSNSPVMTHPRIMANRRILFIAEDGASAKLLVCDHSMGDTDFLSTEVVEIFAGRDAVVDYYDLEESSIRTRRFSSLFVEQEAGSNVLVNGITLNNGQTRNNYRARINGEGAELTLCGMAIADREQRVDTYSHIAHRVPHCTSNELFKYVLDDRAVGAFAGRILVCEGADKTEAYQTNRNICMTRDARMYSKPQLEIYADDVKCSHGMTTGQLDEQALFYMQSRGIPLSEARMMLSVAFTSDVIERVRLEPLKDRLRTLVERRFRGEPARCAGCEHANGGRVN